MSENDFNIIDPNKIFDDSYPAKMRKKTSKINIIGHFSSMMPLKMFSNKFLLDNNVTHLFLKKSKKEYNRRITTLSKASKFSNCLSVFFLIQVLRCSFLSFEIIKLQYFKICITWYAWLSKQARKSDLKRASIWKKAYTEHLRSLIQ